MNIKIDFGQRILLLVPHPDDEVVACSASIGRAQAAGANIFAAYLTNGCVAINQLWPWQRGHHPERIIQRQNEAKIVANALKIMPVFWSQRSARHLWQELPEVLKEIVVVLQQYQIDQVWVPAYEGGNPDHDGLNAIGSYLSKKVSVLEFTAYNWHKNRCNSHQFPEVTPDTVIFKLTPQERIFKMNCLEVYRSEKHNLSYVETRQESYRKLIQYDYRKPPHTGLLWYMRFQWVPFHHPGVDRSHWKQVSQAIQDFQLNTRKD